MDTFDRAVYAVHASFELIYTAVFRCVLDSVLVRSHYIDGLLSAKMPRPGMSFHISITLLHDCILM